MENHVLTYRKYEIKNNDNYHEEKKGEYGYVTYRNETDRQTLPSVTDEAVVFEIRSTGFFRTGNIPSFSFFPQILPADSQNVGNLFFGMIFLQHYDGLF